MNTYNRLTKLNQYGDILYCGPRDSNSYRNMGLYAEDMEAKQIELVLTRLYWMEELLEDLQERLAMQANTIKLMEKIDYT